MTVAVGLVALLALAPACGATTRGDPSPVDAGSGGSGGSGGSAGTAGSDASIDTGADGPGSKCDCAPGVHNTSIVTLSDTSELWSYDPGTNQFTKLSALNCPGQSKPYSLAIDRSGLAWMLFASSNDLMTVNVNTPAACADPGYVPNQGGFGLFGMTFTRSSASGPCEKLYAHSYSGAPAFGEGPGAGTLGVMDPITTTLQTLATIDYDGGELAGSGDGRLFAFAGVNPAKLIEYDATDGSVLSTMPLTGFSKTTASAFAFFGGDIYFFTEATPAECDPCLQQACGSAYAACKADATCSDAMQCALGQFSIDDACGGMMGEPMLTCLGSTCAAECLPAKLNRRSQVHRLDYDGSDDAGGGLAKVLAKAPIRVVGADASTCVKFQPR